MKKSKLILVILSVFFAMNSCNDEGLELTNPNTLSPETFFKTEAQIQSAVNAIYSNLQTRAFYSRHIFFSMDFMAHEQNTNPQTEADKRQYFEFSFDASHGAIGGMWDSAFRGINKANFVINNEEAINAIPDGQLSQERKQKFIGEAKFLRAWYYFFLVTRFGDVPLITIIPESGTGFPRSPKEEVYSLIVQDLQDATQTLLTKENEDNGRATRGAAYALLGKVQLYRQNYQAAYDALQEIYGEYSLEPDYRDNFLEETEFGPESIFEVSYKVDAGTGSIWNSLSSGEGPNEATFRGQEYGWNDWFNVWPNEDLLNEYEAGDKRYNDNFYFNGDEFAGGIVSIPLSRPAAWKKYSNYYKQTNENLYSGINFRIIRYADVLLMLAEAANELGNQDEAIDYINEVRERAGLGLIGYGKPKSDVFQAIVHERKVELAGEQSRFPDLVRWGLADDVLGQFGFQAGKHELFPIPNNEISSNDMINASDQNPGY